MRVCFTHLGCKLNQAEIEAMARRFAAAGHRLVGSVAEADLHVVNTCTVTQTAARESRKVVRGGRRASPGLRTVVTGCWSAGAPHEAASLEGADLVVPNADKELLYERVAAAFPDLAGREPEAEDPIPVPWVPVELGHTRALVKVEDGCNMQCAFCIIPRTRGRQRSRPPGEVIAEVQALAAAGCREVVLTGVQISAYRSEGLGLVELVKRVLAEGGAPRLRLTSIAPWDLDVPLLDLLAEEGGRRLCRHLHLSLQSGATATLRRMRRPYTAASYSALLARVREACPEVAITTDVLVGFPGETAAEFEESLATVAALGFAKVHVFPFSPRPGTAAEALPDQVAPEEKKERTVRLLEVAAQSERQFLQKQLGKRLTVLWEHPRAGLAHGLTDNYIRVFCRTDRDLWNRFAEVEVGGLAEGGVWGEL
ncbi:MAG TPA: tRNA (N(6)-L-threonylcarbamoyladenosine(37)-C(2))-methylthiotransferase MtaB [Thermoanaerobaculia bacterium]|nr:tRNA (N(6)-L-threonylcarbamoyladenosine(37)-C(2))-methylthiotransferase MtaB [Thermoanaerobaculia bacterium]